MSRALLVVGMVASGGCGPVVHRPVQPGVNTSCTTPTYAGYPVPGLIYWSCERHREGWPSATIEACQREVVDVRATCAGVPCTVDAAPVPHPTHGIGQHQTSIVASEPGHVAVSYEITQRDGTRDTLRDTCELEPAPRLEVECVIRDRATGGFVPCGAVIPPGVEVHATGVLGQIAGRPRVAHEFDIYHVDTGNEAGRELLVLATCEDDNHDLTLVRRCTWRSEPGVFRIELRARNAVRQIVLTVR
jgi:hypothetical protein